MKLIIENVHDLKSDFLLENFNRLQGNQSGKCNFCGYDKLDTLFSDQNSIYTKCSLCNSFWIVERLSQTSEKSKI